MSEDHKPLWDTINKHSHLIAEVDKRTDMNTMRIEQQEIKHENLMQQVVRSEGKMDAKQDALLAAVSKLEGRIAMTMWGMPVVLTTIALILGFVYFMVGRV